MSLPVVFRRPAANELGEAQTWYDAQRPGLGKEFAVAVFDRLDFVAEMPETCQVVEPREGTRRALVRRFPYAIYYLIEIDRLVVLAVLYIARDPTTWQGRS